MSAAEDALVKRLYAACALPPKGHCWNMIALHSADRTAAVAQAEREGWVFMKGAWRCPECKAAADGD